MGKLPCAPATWFLLPPKKNTIKKNQSFFFKYFLDIQFLCHKNLQAFECTSDVQHGKPPPGNHFNSTREKQMPSAALRSYQTDGRTDGRGRTDTHRQTDRLTHRKKGRPYTHTYSHYNIDNIRKNMPIFLILLLFYFLLHKVL